MDLGGFSATGPREANEDNYFAFDLSGTGPFSNGVVAFAMVSDGMGGYQGGDVASGLAVSCAESYLNNLLDMAKGNAVELDASAALAEIVQNAHEAIMAETQARGNASMGATFVGAFISPGHAWIGHVGDSRAYLLREGKAIQLTEDHSQVGRMLSRGLITEEEAQNHPARNRIERALGFTDAAPDITETDLAPGDGLLMCSDGVYTVLDADALGACAAKANDAEGAARRVVKAALSAGTDDNSTAVVVLNAHGGRAGGGGRRKQPTLRMSAPPQAVRTGSGSGSGFIPATGPAHVRSQSRAKAGSRNRQRRGGRSRRAIVIPLIVFAILVIAAVALFLNAGPQAQVDASGESPAAAQGGEAAAPGADASPQGAEAPSQSPASASSQDSSPSSGAGQPADAAATRTVTESTPLKYVDSDGVAQSFDDGPMHLDEPPYLAAGSSVAISGESSHFGRDYSYRALADEYLADLRGDCASYRAGSTAFTSRLSQAIGSEQYRAFVAALVESGQEDDIAKLAVYSDSLAE